MTGQVYCGDAREVLARLPENSVHACITSPPYWGLRSYSGAPDIIFGGIPDCQHEWGAEVPGDARGGSGPGAKGAYAAGGKSMYARQVARGNYCQLCGAWIGSYGLEPTPEMYVEHTLEFLRAVRRVLRDDGVVFWVVGDTYSGGHRRTDKAQTFTRGDERDLPISHRPSRDLDHLSIKPKDLVMIPFRVALAAQADGAADPKAMGIIERVRAALLADYDTWSEVPTNTKREIERLDEKYRQAHDGAWWVRSVIIWSKCLAHSVRVYAKGQKGILPMTVGEMARLDPKTLRLWSGSEWIKVYRIEKTVRTDGLEILFRNGLRVSCTPEHKWPTLAGLKVASELHKGDIIEKRPLPNSDTASPEGIPGNFGYVMGLYLADGSRMTGKDGLQFSLNVAEDTPVERLEEFAAWYGESISVHDYGNSRSVKLHGKIASAVILKYISGTTAKTKHLSPAAWKRDNHFLHGILSGYLVGDGHWTGTKWILAFTRNDALADDLRCLGARLGYSVRLRRCWHTYQGGRAYGFRGDLAEVGQRRTKDWEVMAVVRSKSETFYDVETEKPHIFCLAAGALTHNSNPMPESVRDRPTTAHEYVLLLTKSARYYYDADAIREPHKAESLERVRYGLDCNRQRDYPGNRQTLKMGDGQQMCHPSGRNKRTVWEISTEPFKGPHYAAFPRALIKPMILTTPVQVCAKCGAGWERVVDKAFRHRTDAEPRPPRILKTDFARRDNDRDSRKGTITSELVGFQAICSCNAGTKPAVVLDPFAGTGTVGEVCMGLEDQRDFILIDINPEYAKMPEGRIAKVTTIYGQDDWDREKESDNAPTKDS